MRKKDELGRILQSADGDLKTKERAWNENLKQGRQAKIMNVGK